jgi:arginase
MKVQIFGLPYDSGTLAVRMGVGPLHLLDGGLAAHLREAGHDVEREVLEIPTSPLLPEPKVAFELNRLLAHRLADVCGEGKFPAVLAGSCYSAIGTIAGLGPARTGVVWFDSHADFNTPDTSVTGFLDGMSLAILTGRCWTEIAASVPGFEGLPDEDVLLVGARDFDVLEAQLLEASEVTLVPPDQVPTRLETSLRSLAERVDQTYVHIDLDVLDPSQGRANELAAPGGLTLEEMIAALRTIGRYSPIGGVSLTAYDPAWDADGKVRNAAFALLDAVLEVVTDQRTAST